MALQASHLSPYKVNKPNSFGASEQGALASKKRAGFSIVGWPGSFSLQRPAFSPIPRQSKLAALVGLSSPVFGSFRVPTITCSALSHQLFIVPLRQMCLTMDSMPIFIIKHICRRDMSFTVAFCSSVIIYRLQIQLGQHLQAAGFELRLEALHRRTNLAMDRLIIPLLDQVMLDCDAQDPI